MTRIDELQKKYPKFPRQTLIKVDALTHGIKDSDVLYQLGHWARQAVTGTYQSYDHDSSLIDFAAKRPTAAAKAGYVRRLDSFFMRGGWGVRIERDSTSPYEIRETKPGKYGLFEGEEKVQDIYFPGDKKPWPYLHRQEPLTNAGKPVTTVVNLRSPNCITIAPVRHCEYFTTGEQCKFCNYNFSQDDARSIGAIRSVTTPPEEVVEAYRLLTSDVRIVDATFVGGGFADTDREVSIYTDLMGKIGGAVPYKPNFTLVQQPPKNRRDIQRLKDSGVDSFGFDVEVWGPESFAKICPGKAKYIGFERYKEAMVEAVEILGAGNVSCVLVSGATLMPKDGHKTWQESRDVMIEATQWMTKNGVIPSPIQMRRSPGSEFSKDPTSLDRMPPTEHHLEVLLAIYSAMKDRRLYEKMNRFATGCALCCLEHMIPHDIGVFEATGGDISKWLAPVIPAEVDWLTRIVEWIEEQEAVKAA